MRVFGDDGGNDVLWLETVELFYDNVVFYEELTVFFFWTTPVERPAWGDSVYVEGAEDWLFDFVGDCHVILDCVQTPQHEVKYANLTNPETKPVVNTLVSRSDEKCAGAARWPTQGRKDKIDSRLEQGHRQAL